MTNSDNNRLWSQYDDLDNALSDMASKLGITVDALKNSAKLHGQSVHLMVLQILKTQLGILTRIKANEKRSYSCQPVTDLSFFRRHFRS